MKLKQKKDNQKRESEFPQDAYLSELEKASLEVQELVVQTKQKAEELYLKLPELEEFTEVEKHADSIQRAAVIMSKTAARTYAISDELNEIGRAHV